MDDRIIKRVIFEIARTCPKAHIDSCEVEEMDNGEGYRIRVADSVTRWLHPSSTNKEIREALGEVAS